MRYLQKDKVVTLENDSYIELDLAREFKEKNKNLPEILKNEDINFHSLLKNF